MNFSRNIFLFVFKNLKVIALVIGLKFSFCAVILYVLNVEEYKSYRSLQQVGFVNVAQVGIKDYPIATNYEKKDWHDYDFIKNEAAREGLGEQGKGVELIDPSWIAVDEKLNDAEGLHVFISDIISVNRSIIDTRHRKCLMKKYLKRLPEVSAIIVCYNEWPSILLRTIHSLFNRTPRELLKEIIIVNDNSSMPELYEPLENYIKNNFDSRVKLIDLRQRRGLILARMEGARIATGEVLVFLDAHMEVNVNWLPPLLEPIVISPTTVTVPQLDNVDTVTMAYISRPGVLGIFDEIMWYQWFPLRKKDIQFPDKPHQIPIMLGAAFAIRRDYFYDLGQYDEGLQIWNGEQIEISLKLHLCGGDLLEVPCSRASHLFRSHQRHHELNGVEVAARNFKRIAEVWLGDYKEVMYRADPDRFNTADPGDVTKAKLVREKLKCKPFDYFLEKIAPEMYTRYFYQAHYPGYFAWGGIRSEVFTNHCITSVDNDLLPVKLRRCRNPDLTKPGWYQNFKLTWHRKLRLFYSHQCMHNEAKLNFCRYSKGQEYQSWKFDLNTSQLINNWRDTLCLSVSELAEIVMKPCNATDKMQKWTWGSINETALRNYDKIYYENSTFFGFH